MITLWASARPAAAWTSLVSGADNVLAKDHCLPALEGIHCGVEPASLA